jgi:hypothetical protein
MAGFDRVDPAIRCFVCRISWVRAWTGRRIAAEWVPNPIEKRQHAGWMMKLLQPGNAPCICDPDWWVTGVCRCHDR